MSHERVLEGYSDIVVAAEILPLDLVVGAEVALLTVLDDHDNKSMFSSNWWLTPPSPLDDKLELGKIFKGKLSLEDKVKKVCFVLSRI